MTEVVRINAGCGPNPTIGWKNYDNSFSIILARRRALEAVLKAFGFINRQNVEFIEFVRNNDIEYADVSRHIPVPDKFVDLIYTCHMVEHLDRDDVRDFLGEVRRVLKPNGILRVVVPDISLLAAAYMSHKDADVFVDATLMCQPRPRGLVQRIRFFLTGPRHHNWMYDGESLSRLLSQNGFLEPLVLPPGKTTIPNPGNLDLFERSDQSVYVEARRDDKP
jgi:predicted SAM-dependent methyltransferase